MKAFTTIYDSKTNTYTRLDNLPDYVRDEDIGITGNALTVMKSRYIRKDKDGNPIETVAGMFYRIALIVANGEGDEVVEKFYKLMSEIRFFPNTPTFLGAGTPLKNLAACYVLPVDDEMGRGEDGIFNTLRNAALIQQTGGGVGFSFGRIRPKGAIVSRSNGKATGPIGFLETYNKAFDVIAQGGCLSPDTLVATSEGMLRLSEIVSNNESGWKEHDIYVPTDEGVQRSPRSFNNGIAPTLKVRTKDGLEIVGTYNHKVKVMSSSGPVWRRLDELSTGDNLLVMLGQHQGKLKALKQVNITHHNQNPIKTPLVLDEILAFVLGYMTGNGFVASQGDDSRVGFSVPLKSYLIDELPAILTQLFPGCNIHTNRKPNDQSITFVIDSCILKDFLRVNGFAKNKSINASIPLLIRQSPINIVGSYLRGLFEADGSVLHGYPSFTTTSVQLLKDAQSMLIGLGCPVSVRETATPNRFGSNPVWSLRITSHIGLNAWKENIGCHALSRFMECMNYHPNLDKESVYALPYPELWVNPILEEITLPQIDRQGRGTGKKMRSEFPELRRRLLSYKRGANNLTASAYQSILEEYDLAEKVYGLSSLWYSPVESVDYAGEMLTLDIEVENNHTYIANGIVTHNSRRSANMGVMPVHHPDIREFITCKAKEGDIANFNISVAITDDFMTALEKDTKYPLISPVDNTVVKWESAKEIFDLIVEYAHRNGEPGVLFIDEMNRYNPVPHLYTLEATNPCGEQALGPYENCCLGSINLVKHIDPETRKIDWDLLRDTIYTATHFLDNVVTVNQYVPEVPQLKQAADRARRIGLGKMGMADALIMLGYSYSSQIGRDAASLIMEYITYYSMAKSVELAKERGSFDAYKGSIYDPETFKFEAPDYENPLRNSFLGLDWSELIEDIKKFGIRNAANTTIAPTGTISTVAMVEGYGCEPIFALGYVRHFMDGDKKKELPYTSPLLNEWLDNHNNYIPSKDAIDAIKAWAAQYGTIQKCPDANAYLKQVFVVAGDISPEDHVLMQAALQRYCSNSISKTINFPEGAPRDDVAKVYKLAHKLGCRGLTVYVTGSRDQVVLETADTKAKKQQSQQPQPEPQVTKRQRPSKLTGSTFKKSTPAGVAYVTVNSDESNQPFEVFLNVGKAGSEISAISEALGRLISLALRMPAHTSPKERLDWVKSELQGIGGSRPFGFGKNRVLSLPDGVAKVIDEYLGSNGNIIANNDPVVYNGETKQSGDICPECGEASFLNIEGCRKCHQCGYSEC